MADLVQSETFTNAIIDVDDLTLTEYGEESVKVYSIYELLRRWDGIVGITLTIHRSIPMPPDGRDDM